MLIELPEAKVLAEQINQNLVGKAIISVVANNSPHRFAWFHGEPADYDHLLRDKAVNSAAAYGGLLEVSVDDMRLLFGDGVALRWLAPGTKRPEKHQLLVELTDGSALIASVQMYGGLWAFPADEFDNPYYLTARAKPSPLEEQFDHSYFSGLQNEATRRKSAKAFLATEQRIPGLGNGVLQDILWNAHIHPRRPMDSLADQELDDLFTAVKTTLREMFECGGRDTEKDLFSRRGGYVTRLSKNTLNYPCPACGGAIKKEAYMGGSVYYCSVCQRQG